MILVFTGSQTEIGTIIVMVKLKGTNFFAAQILNKSSFIHYFLYLKMGHKCYKIPELYLAILILQDSAL